MLKCLMLQKWFNLSDPGLEEALRDRISFRKFVGLSFTDKTPDETTFVRFRERLRSAGLQEKLFNAVVEHIGEQGLLVREGTMVDATIIEAPRGRKRPDGTNTRDEDASFTRKHGRSHHGYKGHVAADVSGIVVECRFGTAKEHDSRHIDDLTRRERHAVFADSAYSDRARRLALRQRGVIDAIAYKRNRGQASLFDWQERWNTLVAKYRARVEHPFAMLKQQLGYRRTPDPKPKPRLPSEQAPPRAMNRSPAGAERAIKRRKSEVREIEANTQKPHPREQCRVARLLCRQSSGPFRVEWKPQNAATPGSFGLSWRQPSSPPRPSRCTAIPVKRRRRRFAPLLGPGDA